MSETDGSGIADILERATATDDVDGRPDPKLVVEKTPQDDAEAVADKLRRDLAAQTTRAQNAERDRAAAEERAKTATAEVQQTQQSAANANFTTVVTALDARNREMESITAQIGAAGEAGDFRKVAELSAQAGRIGAAIEGLENAKQQMEARRQETLRAPPPVAQPARDPATTVGVPREDFLRSVNPDVANWIRNHDQFFTDRAFYQQCVGADSLLRGRGILPSNPEYLEQVEGILGLAQAPEPRTTRPAAPPTSAAPSRSAPSISGRETSGGDIFVTADQRRLAKWMGIDESEYVAEDKRLRASGEIPHRRR